MQLETLQVQIVDSNRKRWKGTTGNSLDWEENLFWRGPSVGRRSWRQHQYCLQPAVSSANPFTRTMNNCSDFNNQIRPHFDVIPFTENSIFIYDIWATTTKHLKQQGVEKLQTINWSKLNYGNEITGWNLRWLWDEKVVLMLIIDACGKHIADWTNAHFTEVVGSSTR